MKIRKIMALMLAACLLAVNVPVTAFADVSGYEKSTENLTVTASPSEAEGPENAASGEKNTESGAEAGELPDTIVLTAEASDGVIVTVKAGVEAFSASDPAGPSENEEAEPASPSDAVKPGEFDPELLTLVAEVIEEKEEAAVDEALESRTKDNNIAIRRTYDIYVLYDGKKIEPLEGKKAEVSFTLPDVPSGADEVTIYHHTEDGIETIVDEKIDEVAESQAAYEDEEQTGAKAEETEDAEDREGADVTDENPDGNAYSGTGKTVKGKAAKTAEKKENAYEKAGGTDAAVITVTGKTTGFSFYTIDFTYDGKTVSIPGDTAGILLEDILKEAGIEKEITEAKAYQDADCRNEAAGGEVKDGDRVLFRIYQKDGSWYADAVNAFSTGHGLWVKTADGAEYKIRVTDAAGQIVIAEDGTVTYNDSGAEKYSSGKYYAVSRPGDFGEEVQSISTEGNPSNPGTNIVSTGVRGIDAAGTGTLKIAAMPGGIDIKNAGWIGAVNGQSSSDASGSSEVDLSGIGEIRVKSTGTTGSKFGAKGIGLYATKNPDISQNRFNVSAASVTVESEGTAYGIHGSLAGRTTTISITDELDIKGTGESGKAYATNLVSGSPAGKATLSFGSLNSSSENSYAYGFHCAGGAEADVILNGDMTVTGNTAVGFRMAGNADFEVKGKDGRSIDITVTGGDTGAYGADIGGSKSTAKLELDADKFTVSSTGGYAEGIYIQSDGTKFTGAIRELSVSCGEGTVHCIYADAAEVVLKDAESITAVCTNGAAYAICEGAGSAVSISGTAMKNAEITGDCSIASGAVLNLKNAVIRADAFDNEGSVVFDMEDASAAGVKLIDYTGTGTPVYGTAGTGYQFAEGKDNGYVFNVVEKDLYAVKPAAVLTDEGGNAVYYATVQAAVDAAGTAAAVVTMIADSVENVSIGSGKDITLDLNGCVLQGNGSERVISDYGTLTVRDSDRTRTHYFKYAGSSAWTLYDNADEEAKTSAIEIDAITGTTADGTLIKIAGGCITGGNSGPDYGGGAIIVNAYSRLTMTGGSICGNKAAQGGGLYTGSNTAVNLSNVTIAGNHATGNGGGMIFNADRNGCSPDPGLTIGGAVRIIENTSPEGKDSNFTLWMAEAPLVIGSSMAGSRIGLTIRVSDDKTAAGAFTTNGTADDAAYFFSDTAGYAVVYKEGSDKTGHLELREQCTVTLDGNGAATAGSVTSVTAINGSAMPAITGEGSLPTRTGHAFTGYFDAQTGGNRYYNADGTSAKIWDKAANTTLYAQWTAKTAPSLSDLSFSASSCVYDGSRKPAAFTTDKSGMGAITVKYRAAETTEWSDTVPAEADQYYVKAVIAEGTGYASAELTSENWNYTISPKQLTVTGTAADGKTYDGTAAAVAHVGTVGGIIDTDKGDVSVEIKTAEFEDRNAGNGRNVSVSYQVTGTKAGNYAAPDSDTTRADIEKRRVTLTSGSAAKVYDGIPLTNHEVQDTLDGSASEKGFVNGEGALYTVTGSRTAAGSSKNTFTYVLDEETIEDNYAITAVEGDLTVSKVSEAIIITAASGTKVYDGTALTNGGFTYTEGILAEGDILSAAVEGSITDVGTAANRVTSCKVMRGEADVTSCYTFGTSVDGTLEVTKRKLAKPSADRTDFTYSGSEQGPVISGYDEGTMTAAGKGKEAAAGNYTLTYALKDRANYCWADDSTENKTIEWVIARAAIAVPSAETGLVYDGNVKTGVKGGTGYTLTGNTGADAGSYTATAALDRNHKWNDNTTENKDISWSIAKAAYDMSGVSFADKEVRYDGTAKSLTVTGSLPDGVTVSYEGNGKTEAGVYIVTAKFSGDAVNYEAIPDKTAKLTITAQVSYRISYDLNGGRWCNGGENPTEYTAESSFTLKAPERDGYVFIGWEGTDLKKPETLVIIGKGSRGDRIYKAIWNQGEERKIAGKTVEVTGEIVTSDTELTDEKAKAVSNSAANTTDFSSDHVEEEVLKEFAEDYPEAKTFSFGITVELKAFEESKQTAFTGTKLSYDAAPFIQAIDTDGTVHDKITVPDADLNGKSVKLHLAVPGNTGAASAEIEHVSTGRASETCTSKIYTDESGEKYVEVFITHFSTFEITLKESGSDPQPQSSDSSSEVTAAWIKDAKGWRYRFADGSCAADGWYEIDNPYAGSTQERKSWFHFGADGYMQTGWFTDKDDKKYYLHPVSDGTLGRMYHGKQTVDGKAYEFSEIHNGYYGHLIETGTEKASGQ